MLAPADLAREAAAGIMQRPGRSALTIAGTVLGIGAFVAILGLTSTAAGQISHQFSIFAATQVTVTDVGDSASQSASGVLDFPADADQRVAALHGVIAGGVAWQVDTGNDAVGLQPSAATSDSLGLTVYAATPGLLRAAGAVVTSGVLFSEYHEDAVQPVAVLGTAAAAQLGITSARDAPEIFIGSTPLTVIGIVSQAPRLPALGLSVIVPASLALHLYGAPAPSAPATMIIHTQLGAARLVARQVPVALRPDNSRLLSAVAEPSLAGLQHGVAFTVNSLFLLLAAVTVAVGSLGIANTTLVAVLERTPEIGLRRALGARPRHIAGQILAESTALGLIGSLAGTALGIATVLVVAITRQWTAILNPAFVYPAPIVGAITGLLAGAYPALRAASIEPATALRR